MDIDPISMPGEQALAHEGMPYVVQARPTPSWWSRPPEAATQPREGPDCSSGCQRTSVVADEEGGRVRMWYASVAHPSIRAKGLGRGRVEHDEPGLRKFGAANRDRLRSEIDVGSRHPQRLR